MQALSLFNQMTGRHILMELRMFTDWRKPEIHIVYEGADLENLALIEEFNQASEEVKTELIRYVADQTRRYL